jgi:uncharacterized protein YbjT (DUF2867 family)
MTKILVTGSTGQLGAPTTAALRAAGYDVRGLTRAGGEGAVAGDIVTGQGLDDALRGIDTVVHLATTNGARDVVMAKNLTAAAQRMGVSHFVLISIVGIERIPLGFYRDRVVIEDIVMSSGLPFTIQRATQFHSFIDTMFSAQKFLPLLVVPRWTYQPIDIGEVASRLAELAQGAPRGRVDDIGGPAQRSMRDLHAAWKKATGSKRGVMVVHLPGALFAAYDAGVNLVPGAPEGRGTFEAYLEEKYR